MMRFLLPLLAFLCTPTRQLILSPLPHHQPASALHSQSTITPYSPPRSNLLASLSFSTYVPPSTNRGRLENGSCDVQVHHLSYLPTYKHVLLLTLLSVNDLPRLDQGLVDGTLTGKDVDIYALFSLLSEGRVSPCDVESLKRQVNDGLYDLETLEDVHRTETTWSNKGGNFVPPSGGLLGIGQKAASVEFSDNVEGGKVRS